MKKRSSYSLAEAHVLFLTIMLSGVASFAGDWYGQDTASESSLAGKILEFKKKIDKMLNDFDALKALGIASHILATNGAQTYVLLAYKTLSKACERNEVDCVALCYFNLVEFYDSNGMKEKAESYSTLADDI